MISALVFIICFIGLIVGAIAVFVAFSERHIGMFFLTLAFSIFCVFIMASILNEDTRKKEQQFQQAIVQKKYKETAIIVAGVYKDKIVSNEDETYTIDVKYSEILSTDDIKVGDILKVTYVDRNNFETVLIRFDKVDK